MSSDPQGETSAPRPALDATRVNMLVIAVAYSVFALSLLIQPARWAATPAYANLLVIMPQQAWGAQFAAVAVVLGIAALRLGPRWLTVASLSLAAALTTTWLAAFIVRWATNGSTTPETWVSWAIFDFLLLRALLAGGGSTRHRDGGSGG